MKETSANQWQFTIPFTTKTQYITGLPALNLPAPEDTTGDSHFLSVFFDSNKTGKKLDLQVAGDGQDLNTNHIYGSYGIHECSAAMKKRRLQLPREMTAAYVANHYRAILDLAYESLNKHQTILGLTGVTEEWLDTEEQKVLVLEKALEMLPFLNEQQSEALLAWIEKEKLPGYWS